MSGSKYSPEDARTVGSQIGIDFSVVNLNEFCRGLEVELEHGPADPETDVTGNDISKVGKIAWAHLKEMPDYYTRLDRMWEEAMREQNK